MADQTSPVQDGDTSGVGARTAAPRVSVGVPALDRLLQGGLPRGNSLLVQGAPGTGKTILGMQFVQAGITRFEEPGLMITFEEHPRRLLRDAQALGWDFEGFVRDRQLLLIFTSPEALLRELADNRYGPMIREYGLKRVVVDSLTQFESYPDTAEQIRVRFERVVNALRLEGLTVLMTRETSTRETPFPVTPEEYLADTIVQLEYRRQEDAHDTRRIRLLEVLKHRGSAHSSLPHPFTITEGGLQIPLAAAPQF